MQTDCIILGGGAAGLCAAAALSRTDVKYLVLEHQSRVGRKILSTGNGRCNLSNTDLSACSYGHARTFVESLYIKTPPQQVFDFLSSLGLMTTQEEGRIYPRTMAASTVLDVLRAGIPAEYLFTEREVTALTVSRKGGFCVQTQDGEQFSAPAVLMALGGCAAPQFGTDGAGTRLCASLGHRIVPLYPALVQLRCAHPALRSLKGVRAHAKITLHIDGCPAAQETGELLFADYGVSGVCVFQISADASRALGEGKQVLLTINLLPEISNPKQWLDQRIDALSGFSAAALLTGVFPRILAQALLRYAGIGESTSASSLDSSTRAALVEAISALPMPVLGTRGFANAQVTAGGVALDEVDPNTMTSRLYDGLYLAGEVLDVNGPCGGYNLHFAFASALTAAKAITHRYCAE